MFSSSPPSWSSESDEYIKGERKERKEEKGKDSASLPTNSKTTCKILKEKNHTH